MPEKEPNMVELFQRVDFFSDLDAETLGKFIKIATIQQFRNDETIMLAGDARRAIFFITKGQAKVFYESKNSRNGILSLLDIGDFFGEIQLFNGNATSSYSAKSEGECSVIILRGEDFKEIVTSDQRLSAVFIEKIAQKLNRAYMQAASLSMNTIKKRIAACLMQFINERGVRTPFKSGKSEIVLRNRPTQQQIAEMTGTTRETVNRELAILAKEGYIELDGKDLIMRKELEIDDN
jgi:CRP-like cAMP-binding protein